MTRDRGAATPADASGRCGPLLTRRRLLLLGGATVVAAGVPAYLHATREPGLELVLASYPRRKVGRLSELRVGRPVAFTYPFDHPHGASFLYKLGVPAGGGIGPGRDVVAFNDLCPHQGVRLAGQLDAEQQVLGPCPLHLSTFDLTRHGMVVSGHATDGLPQVVLELAGDDIYATGVMGLVFGFHDNLLARPRTSGRAPG